MKIRNTIHTVVLLAMFFGIANGVYADILSTEQIEAGECLPFQLNPTRENCEKCRQSQNYPDYYCDCHLASASFYYGMDTIINSVTWFHTTLDEVTQNGLSAYWFSDASVTVELFAVCTGNAQFTVVIGPNRAMSVTPEEILSRIDVNLGSLADDKILHLRITPTNDAEGHIMTFHAENGPSSDCQNTMQAFWRMPFFLQDGELTLMLPYSQLQYPFFIQWKEQRNRAVNITVDNDCQMTNPILLKTLHDSTRVLYPDTALMKAYYNTQDTLFFNFQTQYNGKITFFNNILWSDTAFADTLCQGKQWTLPDTILTQTTTFNDTLWLTQNQLYHAQYQLLILPTDTVTDTLYYQQSELPVRYKNTLTIRNFGDYKVNVTKDDGCEQTIKLHVEEIITPTDLNTADKDLQITQQAGNIIIHTPENARLSVRDILGREVIIQTLQQGENLILLPQKGSYILRINTSTRQVVRKILRN